MNSREFLAQLDEARIVAAIAQAEKGTSGEIRVFVSEREVDDVVERAERRFEKLGMTRTALRNGVLLYCAPRSQKFAARHFGHPKVVSNQACQPRAIPSSDETRVSLGCKMGVVGEHRRFGRHVPKLTTSLTAGGHARPLKPLSLDLVRSWQIVLQNNFRVAAAQV